MNGYMIDPYNDFITKFGNKIDDMIVVDVCDFFMMLML